jgi:hypothetical protein
MPNDLTLEQEVRDVSAFADHIRAERASAEARAERASIAHFALRSDDQDEINRSACESAAASVTVDSIRRALALYVTNGHEPVETLVQDAAATAGAPGRMAQAASRARQLAARNLAQRLGRSDPFA